MSPPPELIEGPLTTEELAARYRALCDDPLYANVPGKIEIDLWGRMVMSPASNYHGELQIRLGQRLAVLGGRAIAEASVVTKAGVFVADVAWASAGFLHRHNRETPFASAPELCIEIASPSSSVRQLEEKRAAYFTAGAREAWIVYPQSKRCEFYGPLGVLESSAYSIGLAGLFDDLHHAIPA